MKNRWQRVLDALEETKDEKKIEEAGVGKPLATRKPSKRRKRRESKKKSTKRQGAGDEEAKEEEFKKEVRDSIAKLTDAVSQLVKDKAKDEEEEEAIPCCWHTGAVLPRERQEVGGCRCVMQVRMSS